MDTNKVLPFPKDQTVRVRLRERNHQQKTVLALSILSVLMFSVLSNQWITRPQSLPTENGRTIASFTPNENKADIQWEHELARTLSQSQGITAHLGVKPSLRDELIYGSLAGRYGMKLQDGRVASLEFIKSHESDLGVTVKNRAEFFRHYRSVFAVSFVDAGLSETKGGVEVWNLIGADQTIVGKAFVSVDAEGHMNSVSFQR